MGDKWQNVSAENPCQICGRPDWCKVSGDGCMAWCGRVESGAVKAGPRGGWIHRLAENSDYRDNGKSHAGNGSRKSKVYPTPDGAISAALAAVKREHADAVLSPHGPWAYTRNGVECMRVVRIDLPGKSDKTFRPIHAVKGGWAMGDCEKPLPLYRGDELPAGATVWICEGERKADTARSIGLVAVASAHGSGSAAESNWQPLAGRECIILPDADEPGARYAKTVTGILLKLDPAARVRILRLPGLTPNSGDDLIEFLELDGRDCREPDSLRAEIEQLAAATSYVDEAEYTGGLVTRCLADVATEEVCWLWPSRFARGKLNLIGGVPGVGKSWLSLYITAAITRGLPWPDGRGDAPLGGVLVANAEDGAADTIKPRIVAMGGDCKRVRVIDCIKRPSGDGKMIERGFTLADVADLETEIMRMKDCVAVVIDPVSAYLADADEHKNGEVRALLKPLTKMAERHGVAILCITHLTKAGAANAVNRMIGSIAFAGAARSVWMIGRDKTNRERRLMLLAKCNIAADAGGLAFGIVDGAVAFEAEPVTQSADELLAEQDGDGPGRPDDERKAAEGWLRDCLADGLPHSVADVMKAGKDAGISSARTLRRAAAAMKVERKLPGFGQGWTWRLAQSGQQSGQNPTYTNSGQTGQTEKTPEKTDTFDPTFASVANTCARGQTGEAEATTGSNGNGRNGGER